MLWDIIDKEIYKLYINKKINSLELKVYDKNEYSEIYLNYKGYNLIFSMEMWEFFTYKEEWNIKVDLHGDLKRPSLLYYTVSQKDERKLIDLIYFFIKENDADAMIKEKDRIENW